MVSQLNTSIARFLPASPIFFAASRSATILLTAAAMSASKPDGSDSS